MKSLNGILGRDYRIDGDMLIYTTPKSKFGRIYTDKDSDEILKILRSKPEITKAKILYEYISPYCGLDLDNMPKSVELVKIKSE